MLPDMHHLMHQGTQNDFHILSQEGIRIERNFTGLFAGFVLKLLGMEIAIRQLAALEGNRHRRQHIIKEFLVKERVCLIQELV